MKRLQLLLPGDEVESGIVQYGWTPRTSKLGEHEDSPMVNGVLGPTYSLVCALTIFCRHPRYSSKRVAIRRDEQAHVRCASILIPLSAVHGSSTRTSHYCVTLLIIVNLVFGSIDLDARP